MDFGNGGCAEFSGGKTAMTGPLRVLVLTDRFPPDHDGGAEVSLQDTLNALPADEFDIHVASFGSVEDPEERQYSVSGLPTIRNWPPRLLEARSGGASMGGILRAGAADFISAPRAGIRLSGVLAQKAMGGQTPHPGFDRECIAGLSEVARSIKALMETHRPDVIHADNKESILVAANLRMRTPPIVAMVRDSRFFCAHATQRMFVGDRLCETCSFDCAPSGLEGAIIRRALTDTRSFRRASLAVCDRVITTSDYLVAQIGKVLDGIPVTAIGNPHPANAYIEAARSTTPQEGKTVLFAGNLRPEKGALLLAEALPHLADIPDLRMVFAGRGPAESRIREIAAEAGLAARISLPGFLSRDQLYAQMASCAIVVSPTLAPEGFGRLPLEAGLLQRPVIASAIGGHLETIIDGQTGRLFPAGDKQALAEAMRDLLTNEDKARTMGRAAEAHVKRQFAPELIAARLGAVWNETSCRNMRTDTSEKRPSP